MKVTASLDGVPVTVDSPWWPEEHPVLVPSPPGSAIQAATSSSVTPAFGQVTLVAVPFNMTAPSELPGVVATRDAVPVFRNRLEETRGRQRPARLSVPRLRLFGAAVDGSASIVDIRFVDDRPTRVLIAEWVTQAGPRLWILRLARAVDPDGVRDDVAVQRFLASLEGLQVSADERALKDNPSTLLLAPELRDVSEVGGPSPVLSGFGGGTPGLPSISAPPWWQGAFDDGHYFPRAGQHSGPLGANFSGLVACGPRPITGGNDVVVQFFAGAHGEFEWECVELSMRWLFQAYGVSPYPGNGNQVVPNFPGGGSLVTVANGTANHAPTQGDVLSLGPADPFGHTAVVMDTAVDQASGNGTITIIEQNSSVQGKQSLQVTGWSVKAWLAVSGWLHLESSVIPPPAPVAAMAYIWGGFPFNPAFAIPEAWLAQLQAGQYMGRPLSGEVPIPGMPNGAVFQVFEHGLATFVPGQAQASFTGVGLSDAQVASIAQTGLFWGATIPFNAGFANPRAWTAALRGGTYIGRPVSGEVPIPGMPNGVVFQVFEHALTTFMPGQAQASFTGAGLSDAQLGAAARLSYLWGGVPFIDAFALPAAWLAQLRAGIYRGRPLSGEIPIPAGPNGAVFQVFEHGLATFVPGQAQASFTGAGLSDAQVASIAQSNLGWGTIPFVPPFAVPQAWLTGLRSGKYVGRPLSPEVPNPSAGAGTVFQVFEHGLATFVPGPGVTWTG